MRCPRCNGCLYQNIDLSCINCGWMKNDPLPAACVSTRFYGTNTCEVCGDLRLKYFRTCRTCHGARIKQGMNDHIHEGRR